MAINYIIKLKIIFLIFSLDSWIVDKLCNFFCIIYFKKKINEMTFLSMPHMDLSEYLMVGTIMANRGIVQVPPGSLWKFGYEKLHLMIVQVQYESFPPDFICDSESHNTCNQFYNKKKYSYS